MDADEFLTIAQPAQAQTRVMASKFLGSVLHIESPEEFERQLSAVQKQHYDATHWCWAWRSGRGSELLEKSSDAGEPRGTAGPPILRELQSRELTDCAIIVTRWFGGTKLGTGNLARAYGDCAAVALDKAKIVKRRILVVLAVESAFDDQGIVYHLAGKHNAQVEPAVKSDRAAFTLKLRRREVAALTKQLTDDSAGRIQIKETGTWIS
jgi:uncharacterized YigZ family protein